MHAADFSPAWSIFPTGLPVGTVRLIELGADGDYVVARKGYRQRGAIVGAKVIVENPELGVHRDTVTSAGGDYQFVSLQPGSYELTIEAQGFRRFEHKLQLSDEQSDHIKRDP